MNCRWNRTRERRWRKRPKKKRKVGAKKNGSIFSQFLPVSFHLFHPSILPDNTARFLRIPSTIYIYMYVHHALIHWCHNACPSSVAAPASQIGTTHTQVQQQIDWSPLTGKFISAFRLPPPPLKRCVFKRLWQVDVRNCGCDRYELQCYTSDM